MVVVGPSGPDVRVFICGRQALEPATMLWTVADEIHRPRLVRLQRHLERTTLHRHVTLALAPQRLQPLLTVDPLHPLAVDRSTFATDQGVDAAEAEVAALRSERLDHLAKPTLISVTTRRIP
jgi:hypothetical protein